MDRHRERANYGAITFPPGTSPASLRVGRPLLLLLPEAVTLLADLHSTLLQLISLPAIYFIRLPSFFRAPIPLSISTGLVALLVARLRSRAESQPTGVTHHNRTCGIYPLAQFEIRDRIIRPLVIIYPFLPVQQTDRTHKPTLFCHAMYQRSRRNAANPRLTLHLSLY